MIPRVVSNSRDGKTLMLWKCFSGHRKILLIVYQQDIPEKKVKYLNSADQISNKIHWMAKIVCITKAFHINHIPRYIYCCTEYVS